MYRNKGITLIVLIITIIVLLILAGISLGSLTSNNGILKMTINSKNETEIAQEKEIVKKSAVNAMEADKFGNVRKNALEEALKAEAGENKTKVYEDDKSYVVEFLDSNRFYEVDSNQKVNQKEIEFDSYPGDFTKNIKGKSLSGSADEPYEINCIEDLCAFSNSVNSGKRHTGKYIVLKRNLDFKSELSYVDGKIYTEGHIVSCNSIRDLMNLLTNEEGTGFYPIGPDSYFGGTFDGNNYEIKNIYENNADTVNQGLFGFVSGATIKNVKVQGIFIKGDNTGGIVGRINGGATISNCISKVNISSAKHDVGGILASIYGGNVLVLNSINYGSLSGGRNVGSIVGFNWGTTLNVYNCANYESTKNVVTYTFSGSISNKINVFNMKDVSEDYNTFINEKNTYIEENSNSEGIDTTDWVKWKIGDKGYPTLDYTTIWDGEKWTSQNK